MAILIVRRDRILLRILSELSFGIDLAMNWKTTTHGLWLRMMKPR